MNLNFRKAFLILTIFLILAGIHLYIYAQNITLKYENTDLKIKLMELEDKNQHLKIEIAQKENLSQVEKVAKEKLGMIYPKKINYVIVSKEVTPKPM